MKHNRKIMYVMTLIVFTSLCFGVGERLWLVSMYPYGNYGLAYNPSNDCVYYTNFYERDIYIRTADSNCTSVGTIPAPNNDSACVDIKYCAYDNTFWVLCKSTLRVYKIDQSGNVLRWFSSPANDYPAGLAWDEGSRQLYISDRRTTGGTQGYIYCIDTMGTVIRQMNHPITTAWYGPRGLAYLPEHNGQGPYLLNVFTFFNSSSSLDSTGVLALDPMTCQVQDFFRYCHPNNDSSNIRGVEVDPRNGDYWINLFQYGT